MDIDHPLRLVASGAAVKATTYARDRIVLCISPMARVDLPPRNPLTVLRNKALAHIAISDPQRTIAGKAALQAMRAAHIYDVTVQRKFLVGDDSSQVAQFVQNGSADVALLPLSAVRAYSLSGTRVISIPASLAPPIRMGAVVMKSSKHSREAQEFIQVAASAEGSAIFSRYGFEAPRRVRTLNRR
jgi:molybdate transport system substrate-binding protein